MSGSTARQETAAPVDVAPRRRRYGSGHAGRGSRLRRVFVWVYALTALSVAAGVLLQAFSIAAYVRGAGSGALDLHVAGGAVTHSVEIVVFLAALVGYWGRWRRVGATLLLPLIGTVQVFAIGDTNTSGGWVNGLHGLLALVVLLLATALAEDGRRTLTRRGDVVPEPDAEKNSASRVRFRPPHR